MTGGWLIVQLNAQAPGLWLVISLAATFVLALLPARWLAGRRYWWWLANWLLIPYCGLLAGAISPRLMGLAHIDWVASLGAGLLILFAMLVLLAVVRAFMVWSIPEVERDLTGPAAENPVAWRSRGVWASISVTVLATGALQFHWCFLRGAIWEVMLGMPDPPSAPSYWAVWLAAALALLQIVLARPGFLQLVCHVTLLTMTSVLFLYSRNFWLCWILHALGSIILEGDNLPVGLEGLRQAPGASKRTSS